MKAFNNTACYKCHKPTRTSTDSPDHCKCEPEFPKLVFEIEGVDKVFKQIPMPQYFWFNPDSKEPTGGIEVNIRSWYPAWLVRLKTKYVLWKNKNETR